jgi:hypothetical protein
MLLGVLYTGLWSLEALSNDSKLQVSTTIILMYNVFDSFFTVLSSDDAACFFCARNIKCPYQLLAPPPPGQAKVGARWGFDRFWSQILAWGVGHLTTALYRDRIIAIYAYLLAGNRVGISQVNPAPRVGH